MQSHHSSETSEWHCSIAYILNINHINANEWTSTKSIGSICILQDMEPMAVAAPLLAWQCRRRRSRQRQLKCPRQRQRQRQRHCSTAGPRRWPTENTCIGSCREQVLLSGTLNYVLRYNVLPTCQPPKVFGSGWHWVQGNLGPGSTDPDTKSTTLSSTAPKHVLPSYPNTSSIIKHRALWYPEVIQTHRSLPPWDCSVLSGQLELVCVPAPFYHPFSSLFVFRVQSKQRDGEINWVCVFMCFCLNALIHSSRQESFSTCSPLVQQTL